MLHRRIIVPVDVTRLAVGIERGGESDGCLVAPWSREVRPRDEWRDDFRPLRGLFASVCGSARKGRVMASVGQ
jgi:hypothetical protein